MPEITNDLPKKIVNEIKHVGNIIPFPTKKVEIDEDAVLRKAQDAITANTAITPPTESIPPASPQAEIQTITPDISAAKKLSVDEVERSKGIRMLREDQKRKFKEEHPEAHVLASSNIDASQPETKPAEDHQQPTPISKEPTIEKEELQNAA